MPAPHLPSTRIHGWTRCGGRVLETRVDTDLVLVYGTRRWIIVINRDGAALWRLLKKAPVYTRTNTVAHTFMDQLKKADLIHGDPVLPSPSQKCIRSTDPRVLHKGVLELLVYGVTGEKPGFGPRRRSRYDEGLTTNPKWPFPEID